MKNSDSTDSQGAPIPAAPKDGGFAPLQWLKSKRISYLTLPLLFMATVTEFVILATGWKYQQVVCLPQGMGVTFFGIGPIGATILAVELLKLPLAIWTASRQGWQKGIMIAIGLPLICLLTFQLVKDMAVYEMGVALAPASLKFDEASKEEVKIKQLKGQLVGVDEKKTIRDRKLAELAATKAKAKTDLEESLKRNGDARTDAISLTDYQKKELADVDAREATIIKQFDADTAQLTKELTDLRARREVEVPRSTKWNAEEARIDNDYKAKLSAYTNKKTQYDKDKAEYDSAGFIKRELMHVPVDPGVPPQRESNTVLKPTLVTELDAQIKTKEAELLAVNTQRRARIAQVEDSAHQLRAEFDQRSSTKREASDRKRDELITSQAALATQWATEEKQIDQEYEAASQKVDGIRAELDDCQKKAEVLYEARETAIKNTQVHRIATTVEIVRGLFKGQRPVSITATAKERGDLYTDQISMVRIYVYPVLAFIVAFLPTLMVEIGFSTVFQPEQTRVPHRIGFLGRALHQLYIRAGRHKILRAERLASKAANEIAIREKAHANTKAASETALAAAKTASEIALAEKEVELKSAWESFAFANAEHEALLATKETEYAEQLKTTKDEWVTKLAGMADSLNRAVVEKDALKDFQKSEIERQIQMRQNAWSERVTQLRQELDTQRAAAETERTELMQSQHKKLMEVSEDCKTQVIQARRQAADVELAAVETAAKLTHDLKEAIHARDEAETQRMQLADSFNLKLTQTKDDAARELDKALRTEKHRFERQQLEFTKNSRQREEDFERQLKQAQQELSLGFDARLVEETARIETDARRREGEIERQLEARALEVDARWKQESQQKEEISLAKSRQRDQQWQAKLDAARAELQTQTDELLRRREVEASASQRETEIYLRKEMQQKEEVAQAKVKQREQDLVAQFTAQAEARQAAAQVQWEAEADKKMRAAVEPIKLLLSRTEQERDEAKLAAAESVRQLQNLEKKLSEASSFLNPWRNGFAGAS